MSNWKGEGLGARDLCVCTGADRGCTCQRKCDSRTFDRSEDCGKGTVPGLHLPSSRHRGQTLVPRGSAHLQSGSWLQLPSRRNGLFLSNVPIGAFRSFCEPFGAFWSLFGAFLITELFGAFRSFSAHQVAKGRPLCCIGHGRSHAPQPRRRRRAQLSARRAAISPRRVSRRTAAFGRQSCDTEGTRVLIPEPCRPSTAGLSCAADASGCTELGSRPKPGLGLRLGRSPQSAVSHRRRTKCRFAIALRPRGASAHPFTCARERLQPGAAAGLPFALRGG